MATSETEPEPGEPPDPTGPEEPDQPGGPRLRMQRVQLIVNAAGVTIGLAELLRGCGG
ncbi:hypothetical protein AB0K92_00280 [Streptomyces sp. NPDC052687]|jgi:hypothetical protein|uniref:hypothetical protein n=1 Tax=unclassified Streptomyces TaxID=2593676 RepID=UPI00140A3316|nr:hypothetical protein [Streptomyces sp. JB150]QIJ64079.1 hypothetical protein G7Z13_20275 [Streptomyces sp. JB150]